MTQNMKLKKSDHDNKLAEQDKVLAVFSYLWILFLIPLLLRTDNQFVQFHAKQGMLLFICWLVGWLVFWLPFVGAVLYFAIILASAVGIISVIQGRYWQMPIIGKYANRINFFK